MKTLSISISVSLAIAAAAILFACQGPPGEPGPAGPQGSTGLQGEPGTSFVGEVVDPCPTLSATHPEVLFLIDGTYYAVYASGQKIHLSPLDEDTTYKTTDGRDCYFKIIAGFVVQL